MNAFKLVFIDSSSEVLSDDYPSSVAWLRLIFHFHSDTILVSVGTSKGIYQRPSDTNGAPLEIPYSFTTHLSTQWPTLSSDHKGML